MIDFIAKIIGSGNDFPTILTIVLVYLGLLWFMFSFWVYVDAKKRYNNTVIAIIFFLVVLIFNFPSLVFYLIVRPDNDDYLFYHEDNSSRAGVNVPVVNFIGQDGNVQLSLELKIAKTETQSNSDMAIDVAWKSNKGELKVEEKKEIIEVKSVEKKPKDEKKQDKKLPNPKSIDLQKHKEVAKASLNKAKNKLGKIKPKFSLPKKAPKSEGKANATA